MLDTCHHPMNFYIHHIIRHKANPNKISVSEYLSNALGINNQLVQKDIFLRRLQNVATKVVNDIMSYACLSELCVERKSSGESSMICL